jgi:predicted AlkP superfamily phosphohydrolase/phosphomutase
MIDGYLKIIVDSGYDIFLMSDHGTGPIETTFHINDWLFAKGYLKLKPGYAKWQKLSRLDQFFGRVHNKLITGGIQYLMRHAKIKIKTKWPVSTNAIDEAIDWDNCLAIGFSQGPVYINKAKCKDVDGFCSDICDQLSSLQYPYSNKFIFKEIYKTKDLYPAARQGHAPDIICLPADKVEIMGGINGKVFTRGKKSWTTGNHINGMYLAYGHDIKSGHGPEMSILDMAPTVLHAMGLAVPRDMDGKVINLFKENSDSANRQIEYRDPIICKEVEQSNTEDDEVLRKRLEALGYLE